MLAVDSPKKALFIALVVLPAAGAFMYLSYLDAPFMFDDVHTIRDNPAMRLGPSPIPFFKDTTTASWAPTTLVRPLLTWTYSLDWIRGNGKARAFHITNLIIHLINSLLVLGLCLRAGRLRPYALHCSILFLLHPLGSACVGYVSNRSTLLSSMFYLAALLAFASGWSGVLSRSGRGRLVAVFLMSLFFAGGLMSKAAAATLPAAAALWALCFPRQDVDETPAPGSRRFAPVCFVSLLALLGLYFAYRIHHGSPAFFPDARPWPVWNYAASQVRAFWTYLRLIVWPVGLSIEHQAWMPRSPRQLASFQFIFSLGGLCALLALAAFYMRRAPEVSFAALFSVIYLLPTSSVVPLKVLVNENRPYLSSLILVWPFLIIYSISRRKRPFLSRSCLMLVLALFGSLLVSRGGAFSSEVSIMRNAVENAPGLARPHVNLASALMRYGRNGEAARLLLRALETEPCNSSALTDLANIEWEAGRHGRAEELYRRAIECDPYAALAMYNLADHLLDTGREEEGIKLLHRALRAWPRHPRILGRLGTYYGFEAKDEEKARKYLEAAAENSRDEEDAAYWRRALSRLE